MLTNKIFNASALKNQMYAIAAICQQGCRQLPAMLLAVDSNIAGIWQQPHKSRCSSQINVEV